MFVSNKRIEIELQYKNSRPGGTFIDLVVL